MGAASIFNRKETALVQIGPDKNIFSKAKAIAAIGLGYVTAGCISKVDRARVAYSVKECLTIASGDRDGDSRFS